MSTTAPGTSAEDLALPIGIGVTCSAPVFQGKQVNFSKWAAINDFVGPNGSGKTTLFNAVMAASRSAWPNKVKILGTGRLSPIEKSVMQWIGDPMTRLFQKEDIAGIYGEIFSGADTSHQAFQLLEKRVRGSPVSDRGRVPRPQGTHHNTYLSL